MLIITVSSRDLLIIFLKEELYKSPCPSIPSISHAKQHGKRD
jgi:hypothetical protein